jgi:hypothetical protein
MQLLFKAAEILDDVEDDEQYVTDVYQPASSKGKALTWKITINYSHLGYYIQTCCQITNLP